MKNERLMIVAVCVVIGSGCLAFGYEYDPYESADITEDAAVIETIKTVKSIESVKAGNPIEGTGVVIDVNQNGIVFIDIDSGILRFKHTNGLCGEISIGDEVTYGYIVAPNGNVIIQHLKRRFIL